MKNNTHGGADLVKRLAASTLERKAHLRRTFAQVEAGEISVDRAISILELTWHFTLVHEKFEGAGIFEPQTTEHAS